MANKFPDGRFDFRIEGTDGVIKGGGTHLELYSQKLGDEWFKWDLETMPGPGLPETYIGTMGDLMNAITENREHISSGRDNLNTVKAYLAGVLSEKLRRPVSPEEVSTYEQKHGLTII
jgi:predicted dehydrogenase